jgi:hypothetical protein
MYGIETAKKRIMRRFILKEQPSLEFCKTQAGSQGYRNPQFE